MGIDFEADIYIPDENEYASVYHVEHDLQDLEREKACIRERMLMMAMGGSSSVNLLDCENNPCDAVDVLHSKFTDLLNWYVDICKKEYQLELYKDYLNEHGKG